MWWSAKSVTSKWLHYKQVKRIKPFFFLLSSFTTPLQCDNPIGIFRLRVYFSVDSFVHSHWQSPFLFPWPVKWLEVKALHLPWFVDFNRSPGDMCGATDAERRNHKVHIRLLLIDDSSVRWTPNISWRTGRTSTYQRWTADRVRRVWRLNAASFSSGVHKKINVSFPDWFPCFERSGK